MTSKVIYKFNSMRDPGTISFNGKAISLRNLINKIVEDRRLSRHQADFDLEISNSQTRELYRGDDTMIAKNTRLTVKRLPATFGVLSRMRGRNGVPSEESSTAKGDRSNTDLEVDDGFGGDIFAAAPTEDASDGLGKLCSIAQQRSQHARQKNRQAMRQNQVGMNGAAGRGALPTNFRPTGSVGQVNAQRLQDQARRVNIGIPKTFLESRSGNGEAEDEGENKADSTTPAGATGWLKYQPSTEKFAQGVKERGGVTTKLSDEEVRKRIDIKDVPIHLLCALTKKLLKDCVVLPCCNKNVSVEPTEQALIHNDFVCPLCQSTGISTGLLKPHVALRKEVATFILDQRETIERKAAEEAEKAANAAEKERERRLAEKKSFNRPDAVLVLANDPPKSESSSEPQQVAETTASDDKLEKEISPTNNSPPASTAWSQAAIAEPTNPPSSKFAASSYQHRAADTNRNGPHRNQDWNRNNYDQGYDRPSRETDRGYDNYRGQNYDRGGNEPRGRPYYRNDYNYNHGDDRGYDNNRGYARPGYYGGNGRYNSRGDYSSSRGPPPRDWDPSPRGGDGFYPNRGRPEDDRKRRSRSPPYLQHERSHSPLSQRKRFNNEDGRGAQVQTSTGRILQVGGSPPGSVEESGSVNEGRGTGNGNRRRGGRGRRGNRRNYQQR